MSPAEPGPADPVPPASRQETPSCAPDADGAAGGLPPGGNGLGGLDGMIFGGWKSAAVVVLVLGLLSTSVFLGPKYLARTEQLARQREGRMHSLRHGQGTPPSGSAAAGSAPAPAGTASAPRGEMPSGPLPLVLLTGMLGLFAATAWIWWRTTPPGGPGATPDDPPPSA